MDMGTGGAVTGMDMSAGGAVKRMDMGVVGGAAVGMEGRRRMLTWQVLVLIVAAVGLSAFAQVALKHGMAQGSVQAALSAGGGPVSIALAVAGSPGVWLGLTAYGLSAVVWLFVLARMDLSVAYAFVALGFLLVMAMGAAVFGEPITWQKALGTLLVAGGIWLVAASGGSARIPAAAVDGPGAPGHGATAAQR
jgi:multidrug transporter EmrE-like cation transporter